MGTVKDLSVKWLAVWQPVVNQRRDSTMKHPHRPSISCSCSASFSTQCLRMAEPCTDEHQGGVAIREGANDAGSAPDLPIFMSTNGIIS